MTEPSSVVIEMGSLMSEKKRAVTSGGLGSAMPRRPGAAAAALDRASLASASQRKHGRVMIVVSVFAVIVLLALLRVRITTKHLSFLTLSASDFISMRASELVAAPRIRAIRFPASVPHIYGAYPRLAVTHYHEPLNESVRSVLQRREELSSADTASSMESTLAVDGVYSIVSSDCDREYSVIKQWAEQRFSRAPVPASASNSDARPASTDFIQSITLPDVTDLHNTVLSITHVAQDDTVYASEVARLLAHLKAWRQAFSQKARHAVFLEQHTLLSNVMVQRLSALVEQADHTALKQRRPWHIMYLSDELDIGSTSSSEESSCWSDGTVESDCELYIAQPFTTSADAYVLSEEGLNFLLARVVAYHMPLDALLHHYSDSWYKTDFIALSACNARVRSRKQLICTRSSAELFASSSDSTSGDGAACKVNLGYEQTGVSLPGSAFPAAVPAELAENEEHDLKEEHKKEWYWRKVRAPEILSKSS